MWDLLLLSAKAKDVLITLKEEKEDLFVVKVIVTTRSGRKKDDYRREFDTFAQAEEDFDQMVMCNCI